MHPRTGCWGLLRSELGIGSSMLWDPQTFQESWSFALYLLHAMALDEVPPVAWMRSIQTNVCSEITLTIRTIRSSFLLFLFCSNHSLNEDVISYNSAINACAKEKDPPGRSNQLKFCKLYGIAGWPMAAGYLSAFGHAAGPLAPRCDKCLGRNLESVVQGLTMKDHCVYLR